MIPNDLFRPSKPMVTGSNPVGIANDFTRFSSKTDKQIKRTIRSFRALPH